MHSRSAGHVRLRHVLVLPAPAVTQDYDNMAIGNPSRFVGHRIWGYCGMTRPPFFWKYNRRDEPPRRIDARRGPGRGDAVVHRLS